MTVQSILAVRDGDTLGAVRGVLAMLMDKHVVDVMLVPLEVPSPDQVTPIVVKESKQIENANPLAPVMRINAAAVLAHVQKDAGNGRLGAVLRPCEMRAVIELAKVGRIDLSPVVLIEIDCMGTYEPDAYAQIARASQHDGSPTDEMLRWTRQGPIAPYRLRNACQMCEHFFPENADVAIGLVGMNVRERLLVEARDEVAGKLELPAGPINGRDKAIARLTAIRQHRREEAMSSASRLLSDLPSLISLVAPCTACGECQDACPYCDCEAFTARPSKEPHTDRTRVWPSGGEPRSATRSPGLLGDFIQLGRRAASCVGCGMCESACPHDIPLTVMFRSVGARVQKLFDYEPGRDVGDKPPFMDFKRDELLEIGESG